MKTYPKCQVPWGTNDALERTISGLDALTSLLVNALHYESGIVGSVADGIYILMSEKVEALREIADSIEVLSEAETRTKPDASYIVPPDLEAEQSIRRAFARDMREERESLDAAASPAFADHEPIDAAELAASLKVDAEVVDRVVSALSKSKAPPAVPEKNARRGKAATG